MNQKPRTCFEFHYEAAGSWPALAWLAICERGSNSIRVVHGDGVECREDWFCEAVWDAGFAAGDFDRTDLVFGSGGRVRETGVAFVSAGSTVDRLQYAVRGEAAFISNSLACLLEAVGARLDPNFRGYDEFFEQIILGIDLGSPDLPLLEGSIGFAYFHNLAWDGEQVRRTPKPAPRRDFSSFENYIAFLRSALRRIADNMASPERTRRLDWLGTISSGYDSATCAALAREVGLRQLLTFDESRPGTHDDGLDVARCLGLDCQLVDRLGWKRLPAPEPPFLVADAQGKEVMFARLPLSLDGKVLITGENGGMAWGKQFIPRPLPNAPPRPPTDPETFPRNYHSGLSLTEYRLHAGFIHFPLPYMGCRQLPDLHKLSNSPAMAPWDVAGDYSRPISRRVLEEAGVPRGMFATTKTGASIRFLRGEDGWSPGGKRSLFRWLRANRSGLGLSPPRLAELRLLLRGLDAVLSLSRRTPHAASWRLQLLAKRLAERIKARGLNDLAFHWATATVREAYRARSPTEVAGADAEAALDRLRRNAA